MKMENIKIVLKKDCTNKEHKNFGTRLVNGDIICLDCKDELFMMAYEKHTSEWRLKMVKLKQLYKANQQKN